MSNDFATNLCIIDNMVIIRNVFANTQQQSTNKPKLKKFQMKRLIIIRNYKLYYYITALLVLIILLAILIIRNNKKNQQQNNNVIKESNITSMLNIIHKAQNKLVDLICMIQTHIDKSININMPNDNKIQISQETTDCTEENNQYTDLDIKRSTNIKQANIDQVFDNNSVESKVSLDNSTKGKLDNNENSDEQDKYNTDMQTAQQIQQQLLQYLQQIRNASDVSSASVYTQKEAHEQICRNISSFPNTISQIDELTHKYQTLDNQQSTPQIIAPIDIIKKHIENDFNESYYIIHTNNNKNKNEYAFFDINGIDTVIKHIDNSPDGCILWMVLEGGSGKSTSIIAVTELLQAIRIEFNTSIWQLLYYATCFNMEIQKILSLLLDTIIQKNNINTNSQYIVIHFEEFIDAKHYISDQLLNFFLTSIKPFNTYRRDSKNYKIIFAFSGNHTSSIQYQTQHEQTQALFLQFTKAQQDIILNQIKTNTYKTITTLIPADTNVNDFRTKLVNHIFGDDDNGNKVAIGRRVFRPVVSTNKDLLTSILVDLYKKTDTTIETNEVADLIWHALCDYSTSPKTLDQITIRNIIEAQSSTNYKTDIGCGSKTKTNTTFKITRPIFNIIGQLLYNIITKETDNNTTYEYKKTQLGPILNADVNTSKRTPRSDKQTADQRRRTIKETLEDITKSIDNKKTAINKMLAKKNTIVNKRASTLKTYNSDKLKQTTLRTFSNTNPSKKKKTETKKKPRLNSKK